MIEYNKDELKENLSLENVFSLVEELGGEPMYTSFGFVAKTICHNPPHQGSMKLYFYSNTNLFKCYTQCFETFDIFELLIKIKKQLNEEYDLVKAMIFIANKFNLSGTEVSESFNLLEKDFSKFNNYERIIDLNYNNNQDVLLKEYDDFILKNLFYPRITPWEKEGILQKVIEYNKIGFYLGEDQITIPHFDKDNRFIGLRGRTVVQEDAERFGKYRPVYINKTLYNHPLGLNLYNLNNSKDKIKVFKKAIVFESEKSCLLYQSLFGIENDISVAVCGFSLSSYQVKLLMDLGVEEIIVAFDRQFKSKDKEDIEFQNLKKNFINLSNKYKHFINISFIFDKDLITDYKDSPIDKGKDIFLKLLKERIRL